MLGRDTAIVAILVGGEENTLRAGKWSFDRGNSVQSVLFPAVPLGSSMLRVQVNANYSLEAIDCLPDTLADLKRAIPFPPLAVSLHSWDRTRATTSERLSRCSVAILR